MSIPIQKLSPSRAAVERGSILVLALWALSLLTIFALSIGYGVRQKIMLVKHLEVKDKLHFISEAGIKLALVKLRQEDPTPAFDALNEDWSNNIALFKDIKIGEGNFTISYDYPAPLSQIKNIRYGIMDEERKININKINQKIMRKLFQRVTELDYKEADDLAAAIIDWRDNDDEPLLNGAENFYYHGLSLPYSSKDAEFEVLEELLLVRGMTAKIFDHVKPYITIFGQGAVNINTASSDVLTVMGLDESLVEKIILFRSGPDLQEATLDDNIFTSPSSIVANLSQFSSLSPGEVAELSNLVSSGIITTLSKNFMIRSIAKLDNRKEISFKIVCIFEREELKGKVKYWREE